MSKGIEIWGVCTSFETGDDFYRINLKTEDGEIIQVSVSEYDVHWDIEVGKHYYAKGDDATEIFGRPAMFADYVDRWGRYCDHCGKHHEEGWWIGEYYYACSDECAIALYDGDKDAFQADLALLDDDETFDDAVTYWTEWYN